MRKQVLFLAACTVLVLVAPAAAQAANTLGSVSPESGSKLNPCFTGPSGPDVFFQITDDPSTPYTVPASSNGTKILQWSTNTRNDTSGESLELVVLGPESGGHYKVVGTDTETLPSPLPAGHVARFNLATPITVATGDKLGLYSVDASSGPPSSTSPSCYWFGSNVPGNDEITALTSAGAPAPGDTLSPDTTVGPSGPNYQMDVAVTLSRPIEDAVVSTKAGPLHTAPWYPAVLRSKVTNRGPGEAPVTFTDTVPKGLAISAAVAGSGRCSRAGQKVTCIISSLRHGQSTHVIIVVRPHAAGRYRNRVAVKVPGVSDPHRANNAASATLTVTPAVKKSCTVPNLAGTPGKQAKHLLKMLGCTVGKTRRAFSRKVAAGDVIGTSPGSGTYRAGRAVDLKVSSGPPPRHG